MSGLLIGKVAVVTGASSGIGAATAMALAQEGASVALLARRLDRLSELAKEIIRENGEEPTSVQVDVTDEAAANRAIQSVKERFGRIDILINNAGVMLNGPIVGADTEDWRRMIELNLLGLMYTTHAALPILIEQGGGDIVNLSSVAGRTANVGSGVYNATKWGVGAFSESLRKEVHKNHIRVTLIEPGMVATELLTHITHEATRKSFEQMAETMRPLQAQDIANAILYAVTQPPYVSINEILIRPTDQER